MPNSKAIFFSLFLLVCLGAIPSCVQGFGSGFIDYHKWGLGNDLLIKYGSITFTTMLSHSTIKAILTVKKTIMSSHSLSSNSITKQKQLKSNAVEMKQRDTMN